MTRLSLAVLLLSACDGSSIPGSVERLAGTADHGYLDGAGLDAMFHTPIDLVVDGTGFVYVADISNHTIRQISRAGEVTSIAGAGEAGYADGSATNARFDRPAGLALVGEYLYVSDSFNQLIRRIDIESGEVTTVAGAQGESGLVDGALEEARFGLPYGIDVDAATGNLWVVDKMNNAVRVIDLARGEVRTIAGGAGGIDDGTGAAARFNAPSDIATDGSGGAWVTDTGNSTLRHIDADGTVRTVAGTPLRSGYRDGPPDEALLNNPWGLALAPDGLLFVADRGTNTIRVLVPDEGVRRVAGTPRDPREGDTPPELRDGAASDAVLGEPKAIAVDAEGAVYIGDLHTIRTLRGWDWR